MKTIIVGVDGSARAPAVFQAALALSAKQDARLIVLRAVGMPVEFPLQTLVAPDTMPGVLLDLTQSSLNKFVASNVGVSRHRPQTVEARLGTAWQVLCDAAKESHADLLVVGSHGYGLLDRVVGTTAARVVNHAPCSVLVVRAPAGEEGK